MIESDSLADVCATNKRQTWKPRASLSLSWNEMKPSKPVAWNEYLRRIKSIAMIRMARASHTKKFFFVDTIDRELSCFLSPLPECFYLWSLLLVLLGIFFFSRTLVSTFFPLDTRLTPHADVIYLVWPSHGEFTSPHMHMVTRAHSDTVVQYTDYILAFTHKSLLVTSTHSTYSSDFTFCLCTCLLHSFIFHLSLSLFSFLAFCISYRISPITADTSYVHPHLHSSSLVTYHPFIQTVYTRHAATIFIMKSTITTRTPGCELSGHWKYVFHTIDFTCTIIALWRPTRR